MCFLHCRKYIGNRRHLSCLHIILTSELLQQIEDGLILAINIIIMKNNLIKINSYAVAQKRIANYAMFLSNSFPLFDVYDYIPVGGRTLSTNINMAFSALRLILLRITCTKCPSVMSDGTKYLHHRISKF